MARPSLCINVALVRQLSDISINGLSADVESIANCDLAFKKAVGRLRGCDDAKLYIVTTPEGFKTTYKLFKKEHKGELIKAKSTDNPYLPESYIEELKKHIHLGPPIQRSTSDCL